MKNNYNPADHAMKIKEDITPTEFMKHYNPDFKPMPYQSTLLATIDKPNVKLILSYYRGRR